MPYKPRVTKIRKTAGTDLTEDQLQHLLHGWCLDTMHHPFFHENGDLQFPFKNDEHRRELYFANKDYLFSLAGQGHVNGLFTELKAGAKPRAFYDYEVKNGC